MTPKYISVSARAVSSQLLGKSEIEMDLFDAIFRRIKQDDDVLYSSVANLRWRHFFESDLMVYDLTPVIIYFHYIKCIQHVMYSFPICTTPTPPLFSIVNVLWAKYLFPFFSVMLIPL